MTTQSEHGGASLQLGAVKYLYTGFFLAGCAVAFLVTHIVDLAWEGHDVVSVASGVACGVVASVLAWRKGPLRGLAMECIDELSAVTWPSRQETYTATVVVMATAITSAVIIFGLDRFWNWITDLIYLS